MVTIISTNVAEMGDGTIGRHTFTTSIIELLCKFDPKYSTREYCEESFYIEYTGTQGIVDEDTGRESTEVEYTVFDTHNGGTVPPIDLIGCIEVADEEDEVNLIFGIGIETVRNFEGDLVWNSGWKMYNPDSANDPELGTSITGGDIVGTGNNTAGLSPPTLIGVIIVVCIMIIGCIFCMICCVAAPDGDRQSPFPWITKASPKVFVCKNTSNTLALEVRNIPDITHPAIGTIEPGERVIVLAEHPEWYKIQMQPKWDTTTVAVVWAMKIVVDEAGKAHELLTP